MMIMYSRIPKVTHLLLVFSIVFSTFLTAGSPHKGLIGPDGFDYPTDANFGGYVWGHVYINGIPIEGATVEMVYKDKRASVQTRLFGEYQDDGEIFMFNSLPETELEANLNSRVTLIATHEDFPDFREQKEIVLDGGNEARDIYVSFGESLNEPTPAPTPSNDEPLTKISDINNHGGVSVGTYHSCAVISGAAWCWGANHKYATLGNGTLIGSSAPTPVIGLGSGVKKIDAGAHHTCALMETGKVMCWGWDYYGNLGFEQNGTSIVGVPNEVEDIENAIDIVLGYQTSCAILEDTTAKCWGYNRSGLLGRGINGTEELSSRIPGYVLDSSGTQPLRGITKIETSNLHMCAIADSALYCWGEGSYLGMNPPNPDDAQAAYTLPMHVADFIDAPEFSNDVIDISTGQAHTCAIKADGTVWCFGASYWGDDDIDTRPGQMFNIANAKEITSGTYTTCVLLKDGRVLCWGYGEFTYQMHGELGISSIVPSKTPVEITDLPSNISSISAGGRHVCAQTKNGDNLCWGDDYYGQLGKGSLDIRPYYNPVAMSRIEETLQQIAPGKYHNCVVTTLGGVQCVGSNTYGQGGIGETNTGETHIGEPRFVSGLESDVMQVTSGAFHSCAVTLDNRALCWGSNLWSQLGGGSETDSSIPVEVVGLVDKDIQSISAGTWHTCILYEDGTGQCWGRNDSGQLGGGQAGSHSAMPTDIVGLSGQMEKLVAGDNNSCAILVTGAVQCWGQNSNHSLGIDSTIRYSTAPVTPTLLVSGTTDIDIGGITGCAIKAGSVYCWGALTFIDAEGESHGHYDPVENQYTRSEIPRAVKGWEEDMVDIAVSSGSACAVSNTGVSSCLGANTSDQIGAELSLTNNVTYQPITTTGLISNVVAVTTGALGDYYCALISNGDGRCWGDNKLGQHGNGLVTISSTPVEVEGLEPAKWTYMLYLAGDNDLSSHLDNISRFLDRLPESKDINIAILFDGNKAEDSYIWVTRPGGGYKVGLHKWRLREEFTNMGNPDTLISFAEWAQTHFPADHFYLSIANHGRGLAGTAWDLNAELYQDSDQAEPSDRLTPADLHHALSTITNQGQDKLDIVHFDSCLNGLYETSYQIKDFATYMIASESLTYSFYPYYDYAMLVQDNPLITPRDLAIGIADTYFEQPNLDLNDQPRTISVFDLARVDDTRIAIDRLANALISVMSTFYPTLTDIRTATQKFDSSRQDGAFLSINDDDEYLDLYELAYWLVYPEQISNEQIHISRDQIPDPVRAAANNLLEVIASETLDSLIINNRVESGKDFMATREYWDLDGSHGVAIYFPKNQNSFDYLSYRNSEIVTFTRDSQWDEFLEAYFETLEVPDVDPEDLVDPGIPPVLRPSHLITNHCAGHEDGCLWGIVTLHGIAEPNMTVTVQTPSQTYITHTAILKGSEVDPIYTVAFQPDELAVGDQIIVTTEYSGTVQQRTLRYTPNSETMEQKFVIAVDIEDISPPPEKPNVRVDVQKAAIWPTMVLQGSPEPITFHAVAQSSDGSDMTYLWRSSLDGEFGSGSTVKLPNRALSAGTHQIEVIAINVIGIESAPIVMTLVINSPTPTPTSTVPPTSTDIPIPTAIATSLPTSTPLPPTATPLPDLVIKPIPINSYIGCNGDDIVIYETQDIKLYTLHQNLTECHAYKTGDNQNWFYSGGIVFTEFEELREEMTHRGYQKLSIIESQVVAGEPKFRRNTTIDLTDTVDVRVYLPVIR